MDGIERVISERHQRVERFRPDLDVTTLQTLDEVTAYVEDGYAWHRLGGPGGTPRKLPPALASPSVLIEHALCLSGPDGLTNAQLRGVVPVPDDRRRAAREQLHDAGMISRTKEARPDRAGRTREQVVWRAP